MPVDMTLQFRTNLGVIFMTKLSKQDKIQIYHLWHDYQIGPAVLSQRYHVGRSNIGYLLALIDRHGLAVLDQPFTAYTSNFKKQAVKRIIVNHESLYHVALDLGLKSRGIHQSIPRKGNGLIVGFLWHLKVEYVLRL